MAVSAIKDERVDADKACRKSETYSKKGCKTKKERTKMRLNTFPRSTGDGSGGNRGKN